MTYHNFHDFRTPTPFKEKPSDHFKYLHKLKLLTDFDVNLTSLPGELEILRLKDYSILLIEIRSD